MYGVEQGMMLRFEDARRIRLVSVASFGGEHSWAGFFSDDQL